MIGRIEKMGVACLLFWSVFAGGLKADVPFRQHRAHHFSALKVKKDNVVFIGNSITNMHEWREAFGDGRVLNRGISGALSSEVLANVDDFVRGKPQKVFLMVGTNDLAAKGMDRPEQVFANVKKIVERIEALSPHTKIYVQSILPSRLRKAEAIKEVNRLVEDYCRQKGLTYVDLWSLFVVPGTAEIREDFTYDGLHPTVKGYAVWCKAIEKYVGRPSVYGEVKQNRSNGVGRSEGMRLTSFAELPVRREDVLMVGDEVQHGGEWAELLKEERVKSRGIGWGYPGVNVATVAKALPLILKGRRENEAPKQLFLYVGTADMLAGRKVDEVLDDYKALVDEVRELSPQTEVVVELLLPTVDVKRNVEWVVPFNEALRQWAKNTGVACVDLYAPLTKKDGMKKRYFMGHYLNAKGYEKVAALVKKMMR